MVKKKIRIGVAGLGRIGWDQHCRALAKHDDFALVAVQDVVAERLQEAKETYRVQTYRDFEGMLSSAKLDAVVVATPTHFHKPMAVSALRADCHVLVEKPLAEDGAAAAAIVRAAKRYDRVLTIFQSARSAPLFQTLKRIVDSGAIGRMYHARIGTYRYVRRNDWQSLRKFGGGMLNNYGVHALDQLLYLCGYDVKRVFGNLRAVATLGDAEDVVKVIFETRAGVVGELDVNQASTITPYMWQVWGTHGAITLTGWEAFHVTRFDPAQLPPKTLERGLASADRRYPADNLTLIEEEIPINRSLAVDIYASFASAIRNGTPLFVKPEESLAVMKLIDRARADSGRILRTKD